MLGSVFRPIHPWPTTPRDRTLTAIVAFRLWSAAPRDRDLTTIVSFHHAQIAACPPLFKFAETQCFWSLRCVGRPAAVNDGYMHLEKNQPRKVPGKWLDVHPTVHRSVWCTTVHECLKAKAELLVLECQTQARPRALHVYITYLQMHRSRRKGLSSHSLPIHNHWQHPGSSFSFSVTLSPLQSSVSLPFDSRLISV